MTRYIYVFLLVASIKVAPVYAQHIKIDKDQFVFLKDEITVSVQFSYDHLTHGGKYISDKERLNETKASLIKKGKDTLVYQQAYDNYKAVLWQTAYIEKINETLKDYNAPKFIIANSETANYTMLVDVVWMHFGYDVGISRAPSKVKTEITFIDKDKTVMTSLKFGESFGDNSDDDNDSSWPNLQRIKNAFETNAFKLGLALRRVFK